MSVTLLAVVEQKEEEREKKKAARKKARERLQNKNRNMGDVLKDAEKRQAAYDRQVSDFDHLTTYDTTSYC